MVHTFRPNKTQSPFRMPKGKARSVPRFNRHFNNSPSWPEVPGLL
jgi:hypothetical protein